MRIFLALVPPDDVAEHLDAFLEPRRSALDLRWSVPEQLHLTLAFLADVEEWRVEELIERTAEAADGRRLGAWRIAGGGAFPDPDRAKVLWAGLEPQGDDPGGQRAALERLATSCRSAANRVGAAPDGGRLRPHVTVARSGRPQSLTSGVRVLDAYAGPTWEPDAVSVIASHLGEGPRGRPRHETLAELPFA